MSRKVLVLFFMVLGLATFGVTAQDEAIPYIGVGETISGEITNGTIQYNVTATAGQLLIIDVVAEGFEPTMEVDSVSSGREVA
ncbi:MAG: hypothetical protein CUN55_18925, partial [Phototrophicales bacterium]